MFNSHRNTIHHKEPDNKLHSVSRHFWLFFRGRVLSSQYSEMSPDDQADNTIQLKEGEFALFEKNLLPESVPWFPRNVAELDKCSQCVTKYEPTTDPRHPGHGDVAYIARRQYLIEQTMEYKFGDPLPQVEYTPEEHATWRCVYEKLRELRPIYACETYRQNFQMLEELGVLTPERIPQLSAINEFLSQKTGFVLRPCSGLLSPRNFLASLAFRVFQTTTYIRHSGHPHHSPEPDLIHELLGHVPMFADPELAQLSQDIGLMSLGASDEQIDKLSTVYWFIVEFGLCREEGRLKAIGAGLLSAYGELLHACSDVPKHPEFVPSITALQTYEDCHYQPVYYVAESIHDALIKLRQYANQMSRPFNVVFDGNNRSIKLVPKLMSTCSQEDKRAIEGRPLQMMG